MPSWPNKAGEALGFLLTGIERRSAGHHTDGLRRSRSVKSGAHPRSSDCHATDTDIAPNNLEYRGYIANEFAYF